MKYEGLVRPFCPQKGNLRKAARNGNKKVCRVNKKTEYWRSLKKRRVKIASPIAFLSLPADVISHEPLLTPPVSGRSPLPEWIQSPMEWKNRISR